MRLNTSTIIKIIFPNLLVMFFYLSAFGQSNLTFGHSKIKISKFTEDTIASFGEQFPVKEKIIPSIKKSRSSFEIRRYLYNQGVLTGILDIIQCVNDTIKSTRYWWTIKNDKKVISDSEYKYFGSLDDHKNFIFVRTHNSWLKDNISWQYFLTELVNDNLYSLPNENTIGSEILKRYNLKSDFPHGRVVYELKVDSAFRNVAYSFEYRTEEKIDIPSYINLSNINNLFMKLTHQ